MERQIAIDQLKLKLGAAASWTTIVIVSTWFLSTVLRFGRREKYLPPGPPILPILGNAHLMSKNLYLKSGFPSKKISIHTLIAT